MPSQVFLAFSASLSPPNLPNPPVSSHLGRELWIKERSVSRCDTHLCQSSADFESRLFRKHFLSTKGPLTDVMLCALMFRNSFAAFEKTCSYSRLNRETNLELIPFAPEGRQPLVKVRRKFRAAPLQRFRPAQKLRLLRKPHGHLHTVPL